MSDAQAPVTPATPEIAQATASPNAPTGAAAHDDTIAGAPIGGTTGPEPSAIAKLYLDLHGKCGDILNLSLDAEFGQLQAESHVFLHELESWNKAIAPNREMQLLDSAAREYQCALLALVQGHYRQAFKGLRLVLELCLQAIHLSTHRVELEEWLAHRKDTVWADLIDDKDGVLSQRYGQAFFPEMLEDVQQYRTLATRLYRECSECVHGNVEKHVPLPQSLVFTEATFRLWHDKAKLVALVVAFALALRYLNELPDAKALEPDLMGRLGHIVAIRRYFGGPEGG